MSIETDLERIANSLEVMAKLAAAMMASDEELEAQTAKQTKAPPKKKSKGNGKAKTTEPPAAEAPSPAGSYPVPSNETELVALMTAHTKGLAPEKMIELGRMMREDFKVAKLPDLPEDDYADFAAALYGLVNG